MWVFVGLATVELLAVHLFVALKWPWLAWPLSVVTGLSIAWIVLLIRSFRTHPHELSDSELRLRVGRQRSLVIPIDAIARVRGVADSAEVKAHDTANLALISYPNRIVDLARPLVVRRKPVQRVALALDDPASFDLALRR